MKQCICAALSLFLLCGCDPLNGPTPPVPDYVITKDAEAFVTFTSAKVVGSFFGEPATGLDYGFYYGTSREEMNKFAKGSLTKESEFEAEITDLPSGKHYFYQAVVKNKAKEEKTGDVYEFYTFTEGPVDLGLPSGIKWDACNIGAELPTDSGEYYAWGETEKKEYYDWTTYKYCKGGDEYKGLTKYINVEDYYLKPGDGKLVLESSDDAAQVKTGGKRRMPSSSEFEELFQNCDAKIVTINGVRGCKFVSKKTYSSNSENFLFVPCAGYFTDGAVTAYSGGGYYWTSTLYRNTYSYQAYYASVGSNPYTSSNGHRRNGMSVRAVCK